MLKNLFPDKGAVESKENSLTIKYGAIYTMIDEATAVLKDAMTKQSVEHDGALALWKELCCFTLMQYTKISRLGKDETAIGEALLPAKVVDWLDPCRGVYVYGEHDSEDLQGFLDDSDVSSGVRDTYALTENWADYAQAVICIQRSVNRRNAVPCDKQFITNDVKIFTTDMPYVRVYHESLDQQVVDAVLMPKVIDKLYPVLKPGYGLAYDGANVLKGSNYSQRLGDSMIKLFQDLGA